MSDFITIKLHDWGPTRDPMVSVSCGDRGGQTCSLGPGQTTSPFIEFDLGDGLVSVSMQLVIRNNRPKPTPDPEHMFWLGEDRKKERMDDDDWY